MKRKHKMNVLGWGTPSQSFRLVITEDNGNEKVIKNSSDAGELMKYFDMAVQQAKEAGEEDGVNRTVSIQQTVLQKNVWLTC